MKIQHKEKGYLVEGKGKGQTSECFFLEIYGKLYSYSKKEFKRYSKPKKGA